MLMKAVIPAAGLGTRLLPTTKSVPKELLPIWGKPAIEHVIEEAVAAGFHEFLVVTNSRKSSLLHYLAPLSSDHPLSGHPSLQHWEQCLSSIKIGFVAQEKPSGLGHALLSCEDEIGTEPFALLLPDNVSPQGTTLLRDLLKVFREHGRSCVALRRGRKSGNRCGAFVTCSLSESVHEIQEVIPRDERRATTPAFQGIGRYILEPAALAYLRKAPASRELDEVPALAGLAQENRLLGLMTDATFYHLGDTSVSSETSWKDPWKLEVPGHELIWRLHQHLREEVNARWNRCVPFGDELFDRWERAAFLGFGKDSSIYDASLVLGDVEVGKDTWIGPFTVLDGRGGLTIGCYCSISAGVQIYSHDTVAWALTGGKAREARRPTSIGDFCYLGPLSIITHGVTIGEHSVVGANSFVRTDVPPYSIAVGSPAEIVGRVEIIGGSDVKLIYHRYQR